MAKREDILRKLKALAERGVGGEAINAGELLKRMMEKYGITEDEISDDCIERCEFRYSGVFGKDLMHQIIFMVCGEITMYQYRGNSKIVIADVTTVQRIEIEAAYTFYRKRLDEGLRKFYDAFVQKQYLFPDDVKLENCGKVDHEMMMLAAAMKKHTRMLEIEGGR